MARSEPQRTCLGCRTEKGKGELLRYVLDPQGAVVPDLLAKLPGRGAYTCFSRDCVAKATYRKQFARAFKGEVKGATAAELEGLILSRLEARIASYLALANKAGKVVSGSDMVLEAMRNKGKKIGLVIMAGDVSADIGQRLAAMAAREGIPSFRILDKDRIGSLVGKGLRSVVAIEAGGFVPPLVKELERYGNFLDGGAVDEQDPRV